MPKILILYCTLVSVHCQVLKNVCVINDKQYMVDVINEMMKRVEERGWWNLPVPDHDNDYDEMIITRQLTGKVKYTNGFVASIQKLSVLESSLKQHWKATNGSVKVEISGLLMMQDLAIGADIVSNLTDGIYHHTGLITYPLANFACSISRDAFTHEMTVTVSGKLEGTKNEILIMPMDKLADVLVPLFNPTSFRDGVSAWGPTIFQPLAEHIVTTEIVKFPGLCYECDSMHQALCPMR